MDHPNIAKVFDAGTTEKGRPYFVMDLIEGEPITAYCDQRSLPVAERLGLFLQLCAGVQHAHSRGIVHRDLKPSNVVVLEESGKPLVKVIDFGIAKSLQGKLTDRTLITRREVLLGTPVYMAPEQARAESEQVDERTDVYGLGAVLYTILTGQAPFHGERSDEVLAKVIGEEPNPVLELEPRVPPELTSICRRAMAKAPAKRYPSARELAEEIQRFLSGGLVRAYTYGLPEHLSRFARRFKAVLVTAAAAVLLLLAGGIYSYIRILNEADIAVKARQQAETEREAAEAAEARAVAEKERAELEQYYRTISLAASWFAIRCRDMR